MKKILEYSAAIYAFLIFLGYSYLAAYYKLFGISIHNFLDASEILLSFLNIINVIVFAFVLLGLQFVVLFWEMTKSKEDLEPKEEEKILDKENRLRKLYVELIIYAFFLLLSIHNIIKLAIESPFWAVVILIHVVYFAIWIYSMYKLPKFFERVEKYKIKNRNLIRQFVIAIFICGFNYMNAIVDVNSTKRKIDEVRVSFIYDSKVYASNDSLLFVGITSNYVFLHDIRTHANFIFEKEKISHFNLIKIKGATIP